LVLTASVLALIGATVAAVFANRPDPTRARVVVRDTSPAEVARPSEIATTTTGPVVAAAAPAPAPPLPPPPTAPPPTARSVPASLSPCEAIARQVRWPLGWTVRCDGPVSGILGMTYESGVSVIHVRAGEDEWLLRRTIIHESGHAWDFAALSHADVEMWCAARGCRLSTFYGGSQTAAEDWAMVWSGCHGGAYDRSYLGLAGPTPELCALQETLTSN
jgi:hypothetical protein